MGAEAMDRGPVTRVRRNAWGNAVRRATRASLLLSALGLFGCVASTDDSEESLAVSQQRVSYDSTPKPIPQAYLKLKTTSNLCCTGANATTASCSNACADGNGLVTTAGVNKAPEYYEATGQKTLTTFEGWKSYFGFSKRLPGEALDQYRQRAKVVVYYNRTELGLGRELGCAKNANGIACYVTNYGSSFDSVHDLTRPDASMEDGTANGLNDAISGVRKKNTVVISYQRARESSPNDGKAVQFAAFGPDGVRLNKAQLDTMGARPIPQICMTCHGGVWDADARGANGTGSYNGVSRFARFLPLITSTVTFSSSFGLTQADQEEPIRAVNEFAWQARGELTGGTPATGGSLTSRQQDLMTWLYVTTYGSPTSAEGTLAFSGATPGRQNAENAWPGGWQTKQPVYNYIALPYCDTCHMAMEAFPPSGKRPGQGGSTYTALGSLASSQAASTTFATFMGVTSTGFSSRGALQMPHAQNAFARFWGDASTFDATCFLNGAVRPKAECFLYEIGFWPNGRPAGATFSPTNPLTSLVPVSSAQVDCGQPTVSQSLITSGADSGRRTAATPLGNNAFINQCVDGCAADQVWCPGAESAGDPASARFPSARLECVPFSSTSNYGSCKACGRLGEPACTQIGATCRTSMNPFCTSLPACHQGINQGGWCSSVVLSQGKTATQSSTAFGGDAMRAVDGNSDGVFSHGSVTHTNNANAWWRVDLGATKQVSWVGIYNRTDCCYTRLQDFVVEYATSSAGPYTTFIGGDFAGVTSTPSSGTEFTLPKPVSARYVQVRLLSGSILSLAEVEVDGW